MKHFEKKFLSLMLVFVFVFGCVPNLKVHAQTIVDSVSYLDWDPTEKKLETKTKDSCTVVENNITSFADNGWYVVNNNVSTNTRISLATNGTANLILCDGCTLTASKGITVKSGQTLNIFGQSGGTGGLLINSAANNYAGIGGGNEDGGGTVTINGGTVTANGGQDGSGIGGGREGGGGTVTINGGTVTATGNNGGSGIGSGSDVGGGTVTINGGTVTATGNNGGSGIGGGSDGGGGTVTINGGTVTATGNGGSGIGDGDDGGGGTVTINGGTVTATGNDGGSGIGGGKFETDDDDVGGGTVTINGGTVTATGNDGGSGIGGAAWCDGGTVTINDGTVTATGNDGGSGIGGGKGETDDDESSGNGGEVTINGGIVATTGYSGIGKGEGGSNDGTLILGSDLLLFGDDSTPPTTLIAKGPQDNIGTRKRYMNARPEIPVESVELDNTELNVDYESTNTLTATVTPPGADDRTIKWTATSGDGSVSLYSDQNCTTLIGTDATDVTTVYVKGTAAGTATVTATSNSDNTKSASCTVTVDKAELNIESATVADKIYDGKLDAEVDEVIIGGLKNNETLEEGTDYVVTGEFDNTDATGENAATKATVTVTLLDTETTKNYYMPKNTITFSQRINKANPIYYNDLSFTVKEGKKLSDLKLPISENGVYTWVEDSNMSVGSIGENIFHVNYTPKDTNNYNIIYNIPVKVKVTEKKTRDIEFEEGLVIKTYGDKNFVQVVSGAAAGVVYKSENTDVADVDANTGEVTIKGAGATEIEAEIPETEEYAEAEAEYILVVNKKGVGVPTAKTELVYNGEEQTGVEAYADAVYNLNENTKKNAGDYKAVATLNNKDNYQWNIKDPSSNDQIIPWSIAKKKIKVKADDKSSTAEESLVELTYTSDGLITGDKFNGNLETDADRNKAGTYKINQGTLTAGDNYEIEFVSGIYTVVAKPQPSPSPSSGSGSYSGGGGWNVLTPSTNTGATNNTVTGEKTDTNQNTRVITKKTLKDIKLPDELKTQKYMSGYEDKTFKPEKTMTRAEVAQSIYKLINKGENINYDVLAKFSDVETGKWYSKAIAYLAEKNIINGNDGKYNPESSITRAETAQILLNLLKSYDTGEKDYAYGSNSYDFSDIDGWYSETVKQLASNRMINGYDNKTFRPNEKIKRAEFVAMIAKVFGRNVEDTSPVQKFPDVPSDYWAVKYINDAAE